MARHRFGGVADYVISLGTDDVATLEPSTAVTCWNASSGGTQYTDLTDLDGVTPIMDGILTTDSVGSIPEFMGPDGVRSVYLDASGGSGPRRRSVATDVGEDLTAAETTVATVDSLVGSHLAGGNPHAMVLDDLTDVGVDTATDGQVLRYDSDTDTWAAETLASLTDVVTLPDDQTISGTKTFNTGDTSATAIVIECQSGQVADILQAYHGLTGQKTTYLNEKGELRVICASSDSVGVRLKGVSGQAAHIFEITDISNNALAWYEPDGRHRAPNAGYVFPFSIAGEVAVGTGAHRIYNDTGFALTIRSIRATAGTAPTGADMIVDVNKGGSTIFTTQANRPTITAGTNTSGKVTAINTTTWEDGAYLTIDVDQVGSTIDGSDLTVTVWAY